jgi:hypothetical protein
MLSYTTESPSMKYKITRKSWRKWIGPRMGRIYGDPDSTKGDVYGSYMIDYLVTWQWNVYTVYRRQTRIRVI